MGKTEGFFIRVLPQHRAKTHLVLAQLQSLLPGVQANPNLPATPVIRQLSTEENKTPPESEQATQDNATTVAPEQQSSFIPSNHNTTKVPWLRSRIPSHPAPHQGTSMRQGTNL